jgi:hypothetical protein
MLTTVNRQPWVHSQHRKQRPRRITQKCDDIREFILVEENIVMGRTAGTEQSTVTLQIKVKFDRIDNIAVDDCASRAISALITLVLRLREEENMVTFANNDKRDGGVETQFFACFCRVDEN